MQQLRHTPIQVREVVAVLVTKGVWVAVSDLGAQAQYKGGTRSDVLQQTWATRS